MPEMHFQLRWSDGREDNCYSPSLVVREHLKVGGSYPLPEFLHRIDVALNIASERVRLKYGYACSHALEQLAAIKHTSAHYAPDSRVVVLSFDPAE
jgi:uncharacterized repeat protein (TIGR04042 family)